jgi:hypothetical protein
MHFRYTNCVAMAALSLLILLLILCAKPSLSDGTEKKVSPQTTPTAQQPQPALERGLAFLVKDATQWKKERKCASCHHGTMTVWALSEAKSRGYAVSGETLADIVTWTKARLADIDKPRDTRPGFNMVNTQALYLAIMALAVPEQDAVSAEELKQIASHLIRHQETEGNWAWSLAPAKNRPPPFMESDEVVTLLTTLALGPHVPPDKNEKSEARDSQKRAAAWLAKTTRSDTTQAAALRLLVNVRTRKSVASLLPEIGRFLERQNKDGSWSQEKGLPGDAYATGQALYALSLAGVPRDQLVVRRGVAFLLANQKEDGSWPMTPRAHPGEKPFTNPSPIIYIGSAWATLGLLRSLPNAEEPTRKTTRLDSPPLFLR